MATIDKYKEVPRIPQDYRVVLPQAIHQPLAIVIDISDSMNYIEPGSDNKNIKLAEEMVNKIGLDPTVTDEYKQAADILVMSFDDNVEVQQDWLPLSHFNRDIKLDAAGCTSFYDAVAQAINAVNARRHSYALTGIRCRRPQIFLFTDGCATDPENAQKAKQLCKDFVDKKKVSLHIILLPGSSEKEALSLSPNVKLYKVGDCKNGLPAAAKFMDSSLVEISSSILGDEAMIPLPPNLKTTEQNVSYDQAGNRYVKEKVEDPDEIIWV